MRPLLPLAAAGLLALGAAAIAWHYRAEARSASERATAASRQNAELRFELKQTRERAAELAGRLAEADTQLGSAKTRATATEVRSAQLNRELSSVRSHLSEREQREVALLAEIESLRQQARQAAEQPVAEHTPAVAPSPSSTPTEPSLPPSASAPSPPTVDLHPYETRIAALEAQLVEILTRALSEPTPLPAAETRSTELADAPTRPPQVVEVGARSAFVVIDRGTEHGLRRGEVCGFTREGAELALGRLSDVRARFAIVQVLPGSLKAQLQPGDFAVLAN